MTNEQMNDILQLKEEENHVKNYDHNPNDLRFPNLNKGNRDNCTEKREEIDLQN